MHETWPSYDFSGIMILMISKIHVSKAISLNESTFMRIFNQFNKALYRLLCLIPEDISQSA